MREQERFEAVIDLLSLRRARGPNLTFRLVQPEDAAYVHDLRSDPAYSRHLSEVRGSVEAQRQWIENYKAREAEGHEFYYVIERKDGTRCGLVRLYDIDEDHFTWGSWILDENKPRKAALESAVIIYEIGFSRLDCKRALFDVRSDNSHTIAFHRRFGARQTGEDAENLYFDYPREQFARDRPEYLRILSEH